MNNLQMFNSPEFGVIRTMTIDGEPYFVGKDVAEILGYSNTRKALQDHVDVDDKTDGVTIRDSIGREQEPVFINESGLYSLILSSKLPAAKRFKRWVTSEVLPDIRKHGMYAVESLLNNPDAMIKVLEGYKEEKQKRIELEGRLEKARPKEIFADAVSCSDSSILIRDLAKMLRQNNVDVGEKRLFKWMREHKYLTISNMPTQKSMDLKLFEIIERTISKPDGDVLLKRTAKVTGKGQIYFINKFMNGKQS